MANPLLNSSFFGAPSNNNPQQSTSTNLFGNLLANAQGLHASQPSANGQTQQQLPEIRLGLDEIERQSESVIGRGKVKQVRGGEGHSLLNRFGVNTTSTAHRIDQLSGSQAGPSAEVERPQRRRRRAVPEAFGGKSAAITRAAHGDINIWGRSWHEEVILEGIEAQRQNTIKDFNKQLQTRMSNSWDEEKKRVLQNELGVAQDEVNASTLGRSVLGQSTRKFPLAQSTSKSAESAQGGLVMHTRMLKYARTVEQLNKDRIDKRDVSIANQFEQTVKDDPNSYVRDAFRIISHLAHEPAAIQGAPSVLERQYNQAYLADNNHDKRALNTRLVGGGRRYLETDFDGWMDTAIANNPKIAAVGGQPGVLTKVRGYTQIVLANQDAVSRLSPEKVNDAPLYAHVYFLLRSGHSAEAVELLEANQNRVAANDAALPGALKAFFTSPDRRLGQAQRNQLMNDFNSHVRSNPNVDQFKFALYKMLGRFEIGRKRLTVADSTEDWTWNQLMVVREVGSEDGQTEKYDLLDFARTLHNWGSATFDSDGNKPFVWVNLLLFAGEFESAVAYLYTKQPYRTDAVHMGIALAYYGLIRVTDSPDDSMGILMDEGFARSSNLNFYRLIKSYISPFLAVEPETALQYAYLIALNADLPEPLGSQQRQLAQDLIRDIVLASRQWSKLLGTLGKDNIKQPGVIDKQIALLNIGNSQEYIQDIIISAAQQSNLDASLVDSLELYHLARDADRVVDTATRALAQSLSLHGSGRVQLNSRLGLQGVFGGVEDVLQLASRVMQIYENDQAARNKVGHAKWEALNTLMLLKKAMNEYAAGQTETALQTFVASDIIPLQASDPTAISRFAARFALLLDNPAVSDLDEVVITAMKCVHKLNMQLRESSYAENSRVQKQQFLKGSAMALIQFASGLRLRLGGDVYRQLSSMSAFF